MTSLFRVRSEFTGFPGAPGVATFYFLDTATALTSLHVLWDELKDMFPNDVHINTPGAGDVIDDATGTITGAWTSGTAEEVVGTSTAAYAAPVGALIRWDTGTILDGRRLRGRTFIVPMGSNQFTGTGRVSDTANTTIQVSAAVFQTDQSASFCIWHRPFAGRPATATKPAKAAHAGGHGLVTSAFVPQLAAVLRSRRD